MIARGTGHIVVPAATCDRLGAHPVSFCCAIVASVPLIVPPVAVVHNHGVTVLRGLPLFRVPTGGGVAAVASIATAVSTDIHPTAATAAVQVRVRQPRHLRRAVLPFPCLLFPPTPLV